MHKVYLSTGSNAGEREITLEKAENKISLQIGRVLCASSVYETEPWGFDSPVSFLNQVLSVETILSPAQVMERVLNIEKNMGRVRHEEKKYVSRIIDIDILLYDELVINSEQLVIPHSEMHKRNFTLMPLCEIAPGLIHPVFKISVLELLNKCDDNCKVWKLE